MGTLAWDSWDKGPRYTNQLLTLGHRPSIHQQPGPSLVSRDYLHASPGPMYPLPTCFSWVGLWMPHSLHPVRPPSSLKRRVIPQTCSFSVSCMSQDRLIQQP